LLSTTSISDNRLRRYELGRTDTTATVCSLQIFSGSIKIFEFEFVVQTQQVLKPPGQFLSQNKLSVETFVKRMNVDSRRHIEPSSQRALSILFT
jgi:hypothetical protein